ncbi:MAG: inorganic diphosphatase [Verrucomicrobia bacterium]|nr:inorganic diphosphatase [Verrucomicrobiota bacterium]
MKTIAPGLLSDLPTYSDAGAVYAVVESPKGSLVKLKYELKLNAFTVTRALPLGLSYPFDWGFVPSTQAPDGDPLDVLILHEGSTYPGVVLACRPLGLIEMEQDDEEGKRERNDRVIVMPSWQDRLGEFQRASDLPARLREEIEQFFLSTTFFSAKHAKVLGWKGPKRASAVIEESKKAYANAAHE